MSCPHTNCVVQNYFWITYCPRQDTLAWSYEVKYRHGNQASIVRNYWRCGNSLTISNTWKATNRNMLLFNIYRINILCCNSLAIFNNWNPIKLLRCVFTKNIHATTGLDNLYLFVKLFNKRTFPRKKRAFLHWS